MGWQVIECSNLFRFLIMKCQAGLATRVLFDQLFHEPQKLLVLGGGCSTATQAIAGAAYHWNLVTVSGETLKVTTSSAIELYSISKIT